MLSSQPQGRGVSPPVREFGVPTVCAACAVIAGATVALQASGGMRGNVTVIAVEVGAVVALTGFLAWRFLGGSASGADKDMQCEPAKLKDADAVKPQPDNGCCKGACGFACEGEAEEKEVGEADISGTDLEDLRSSDDDMKRAARVTGLYTYIQPSTTRRRTTKQMDSEGNQTSDRDNSTTATTPPSSATHAVEGAFLPGRAKIFFKTFGCSHNISDSEYMQGLLHESGYRFVDSLEEADICVVNSCTVKSPSEFALYSVIRAALGEIPNNVETTGTSSTRQQGRNAYSSQSIMDNAHRTNDSGTHSLVEQQQKQQHEEQRQREEADPQRGQTRTTRRLKRRIPCVVAGCVPGASKGGRRDQSTREAQLSWKDALLSQCSIVGVACIGRIVEVVEEALQGRIVHLTSGKGLPPLNLPKIRRNRLIEIVPISTGCLGNCTYCKTKHARGDLGSYPEEVIESRVSSALEEGATQIWLTSEDTGAYGLDIGSSLTKLLRRLLKLPLREEIMLRVGMGNPPFLLGQLAAATDILGHPNVFEFCHLPVQSGSNRVLSRMKRDYTVEQFKTVVDACLQAHPRMSIMTDVICGFPGETEEDHRQTLQLLSEYSFPAVNISQFYPRPGTPAAAMKQLPSQVVKRRSREVTQLFESYTCYDWMVDTVHKVWFSFHSDRSDHTVGHTKQYVKVLVDRDEALLGRVCLVRITSASKWHCWGTLCGPTSA